MIPNLHLLDEKYRRLFNDNQGEKSMFRIALEELSPEEYSAIEKAQHHEGIPYASMAYWFFRFFEASNGGDFIHCCWGSGPKARALAELLWNRVFSDYNKDQDTFRDAFLSKCWAISFNFSTSGITGKTSKIWRLGWNQLLKLGVKEWSDIGNYDAPPAYLKTLLENLDTATGRDFSEFVEDYLSGQADEKKWYAPVFRALQTYYCNGARFGEYLQWREGPVPACMGVGVDHVRGDGENWDLDRKLPQYPHKPREGFYPLEEYEGTVKHYRGKGGDGLEFAVSPHITGSVFYRYVSNPKDLKYHWWKRVPHDGVIPAGRSEVLVCFEEPQEVNPQGEDGVCLESMTRFALAYKIGNENRVCQAMRFFIKARPVRETTLQLTEGWSIRLAGRVPTIEVASGSSDFSTVEGVPICIGACRFRVSDLPEGGTLKWNCRIDGQPVNVPEDCAELVLDSQLLASGFHDVRLTVRIEGRGIPALYYHCKWLPQDVALALMHGEDLPPGWHQHRSESVEEIIGDRLHGQSRCNLSCSDGRSLNIFIPTTGTDYWFARGTDMGDGSLMNEPMEFPNRGAADEWKLILPSNIDTISLEIAGVHVDTPSDYFWNYVGRPSRWRIPLKELLEKAPHEYIHSDIPHRVEIRCNGKTVAAFLDVPEKAVLCQDTYQRWGVYIPSNDTGRYAFVVYTDNTLNPKFPQAYCQDDLVSGGDRGRFYLLEDRIAQVKREDTDGELFLALIPVGQSRDFEIAIENQCPIRAVRTLASREFGADQNHDKLQVLHHRVTRALRRHSSTQTESLSSSRLANYHRPVTVYQARKIWEAFCQRDQLDDLESELSDLLAEGYNFLLDPYWYFNAAEQLEAGLRDARGPRMHVRQPVQKILQDCCSILLGQRALDDRRAKQTLFFKEPFRDFGIQCGLPNGKTFKLTEMQETGKERFFTLAFSELRRRGSRWVTGLQRSLRYQWDSKTNTWFLALANHCDDIKTPALQFQFRDAEEYVKSIIDDGTITRESELFRHEQVTTHDLNHLASGLRTAVSEDRLFLNGFGNMVIQVLDALSKKTYAVWTDSRVVLLAGMATAVSHAAFRSGTIPDTWFLSHGTSAYRTLTQVTRICFQRKTDGETSYWDKLAEVILSWMRIFGNLNFEIKYH